MFLEDSLPLLCIGRYACNKYKSCYIQSYKDDKNKHHSTYMSSLYVKSSGEEEDDYFRVLDYEVYKKECKCLSCTCI